MATAEGEEKARMAEEAKTGIPVVVGRRMAAVVIITIEATSNPLTLLPQSTTIATNQVHIQLTPLKILILLPRTLIRRRLTHPLITIRILLQQPPHIHRLLITTQEVARLLPSHQPPNHIHHLKRLTRPILVVVAIVTLNLLPHIPIAQDQVVPEDIREEKRIRPRKSLQRRLRKHQRRK